jgi:hypothetical protein
MPEEATAVVQPGAEEAAGQGAVDEGSGLYDLASAPDDLRPYLEAELKKIEGNTTRKFQEAAEFRDRWSPYEELGVADIPPEELQSFLEFREIAQDPESFSAWWKAVGEKLGLFDGGEAAPEDGVEDDDGVDLEAIIQERVDEALAPFREQFQSQEEEQRVAAEMETLTGQLDALQEQHGEYDREAVCQLALAYSDDEDAIEKAFADYQRLIGGAERGLIEGKEGMPAAAMEGGQPNTQAREIDGFAGAKSAALERLKAG